MSNKPLSIRDLIKPFTEQAALTGSLDVWQLLTALAVGLVCGLYIFYIYKRTFNGVLYSRSFNVSLILLTLVTTMIIRTISSNLTLSLGMVGALSIVRFRTAVKEAMDTVFMFWAVAVGITIGAGFYLPGVVCTAIIGVILYIVSLVKGRSTHPYLLIIRHDPGAAKAVAEALRRLPHKARLKSKTVNQAGVEVTMEVRLPGDNTSLVNDFLGISGVHDATLVSFQGDYGA
jgi:ABC-type Fe3+ transport system permease subunit